MQPVSISAFHHTPLGWLKITGTATGLTEITFVEEAPAQTETDAPKPEPLIACITQLTEYFQGTRKTFELLLKPNGTDFQQKVWRHLQEIPFGKTRWLILKININSLSRICQVQVHLN